VWYGEVDLIVSEHCGGCHVEGGIAPFALATYDEARVRASEMATAVADGSMPPWMPDPDCAELADERRLSDEEAADILAWAAAGAPQGNPADGRSFAPPGGLEVFDLERAIASPYLPDDGEEDDYHCFVLDPELDRDRFLVALEVLPEIRRMVHHVLFYPADRTDAQLRDLAEPGSGWTCFGGPDLETGAPVGGWVPGQQALRYPEGSGIRIRASEVLVMQVHYNFDNGPAEPDQSGVRLQFEDDVERPAMIFGQYNVGFSIPPGAEGYSATDTLDLPALPNLDVRVLGTLPHMHQLGRSIRVEVDDGSETRCVIDIPDWDFNWQQFYFYEDPRGLPALKAESELRLTCVWDNPTDRAVTWGEGTSDEMCLNYLLVTGVPES
jgi:hypothetical protein